MALLEYAIPMHFDTDDETEVSAFVDLLNRMTSDDKSRTKPVVLNPGEVFQYGGEEWSSCVPRAEHLPRASRVCSCPISSAR